MEYERLKSLKDNSRIEKYSDISARNFFIRSGFNHARQSKELKTHSSTPDPSLTVKMMKINSRSRKNNIEADSFESSSKLTKDKLSDLIRNNAVTFISPNELINQMEISYESSPPERKSLEETQTEISMRKLNKIHNKKRNKLFSNNYFPGLKITQNSLFRKRSKNKLLSDIEVNGQGITHIDCNRSISKESQETRPTMNESNFFNFSKELNLRTNSRPSILCNTNHRYFRCFPQRFTPPPPKSARTFYIPSKNLR